MSNERMGELEQPPNELESMTTTNTERRLAVTPGEWTVDEYEHSCDIMAGKYGVANVEGYGPTATAKENRANAELIADAGTTYNACDMLPSELLAKLTKLRAERNELVGALEDLRKYVKRAPFGTLTEADRVLAKHKPE